MSVSSANYTTPVMVNGYQCKNCTDVDYAKKHIDPAHPKSGPYGINAKEDPTVRAAVTFGGSLSAQTALSSANKVASSTSQSPFSSNGLGQQIDLSA